MKTEERHVIEHSVWRNLFIGSGKAICEDDSSA